MWSRHAPILGARSGVAMSISRKFLFAAGLTCLPLTLTSVAQADELYPPKGMPVGGFRLFPTMDILGVYDDNVFKTPSPTIGSFYFVERPELRLASQWGRHELDLYAGTELFEYTHTTSENQTNWNVGGNGRYDIYTGVDFVGDGSFQILHEPRTSPDLQALPEFPAQPTMYARTKLDAAVEYHPYHFSLAVGGGFERLDYSPTKLVQPPGCVDPLICPPVQDNSDRNRDDWTGFAKAGYEFSPGYAVFVRANYDTRGFDLFLDTRDPGAIGGGIHRASNGWSVDAGLDMEVTHLIVGKVYGGYLEQHYHDPNLPANLTGFDFGANLTWTPTALWTVKLDAAHVVNDTTVFVPGPAAAENDQQVELTVGYFPLPYLDVELKGGYLNSDFSGTTRTDNYFNAGASAKYILNEYAAIKVAYVYEHRDSSGNGGSDLNFADNEFTIGLVLQE